MYFPNSAISGLANSTTDLTSNTSLTMPEPDRLPQWMTDSLSKNTLLEDLDDDSTPAGPSRENTAFTDFDDEIPAGEATPFSPMYPSDLEDGFSNEPYDFPRQPFRSETPQSSLGKYVDGSQIDSTIVAASASSTLSGDGWEEIPSTPLAPHSPQRISHSINLGTDW